MTGRVVILGAAGFIGTALRAALGAQYSLLSVDQVGLPALPGGAAPAAEDVLQLDLGRPDHVDALFRRLDDVDDLVAIIHLVAYYDFTDTPDPRYRAVERGLEYLLVQVGRRLPPEVPFLYASSMAALAPTEPGTPLTPTSPRLGAWQYPAHKLRCEQILESASIPQARVELVLAAVYSPWCELVPLFQQLERIRRRSLEAMFYPGPSDRGLTYVHVDDVADAFRRGIDVYGGARGVHRLLVGEERFTSYGSIHRVASERWFGRPLPLWRVPEAVASAGASVLGQVARWRGRRRFVMPWMVPFAGEHFEFDISETREALGWAPEHTLAEELGPMCDRLVEDAKTWRRRNDARPW